MILPPKRVVLEDAEYSEPRIENGFKLFRGKVLVSLVGSSSDRAGQIASYNAVSIVLDHARFRCSKQGRAVTCLRVSIGIAGADEELHPLVEADDASDGKTVIALEVVQGVTKARVEDGGRQITKVLTSGSAGIAIDANAVESATRKQHKCLHCLIIIGDVAVAILS